MAGLPLAFSIHNFISSVGADAGFAAIIGLAILVLLYFAHARETANLREEAALLTQRLMQAEARVAQLTRAQAEPAAQAVPAAAQAPPALRPVPAFPFAPAGVGAPALAAATRVVPLAAGAATRPATAAASVAPAAARVPRPQPAPAQRPAAPAAAPPPDTGQYERPAAPVAAPAAATVAGANGAGHDSPSTGRGAVATEPPPPPAALRQPPRTSGSRRGELPPLSGPEPRRSRTGRGVAALAAAVVLAAVIAVLVIATSGGSTTSSSAPPVRTSNAPTPHHATPVAAFSPSSVTVTVLNGTNVNQLAHKVSTVLAGKGYKQGNQYTNPNQSETSTTVFYFPGAANRTAALHVANSLNLKPSAVQPIDTTTKQVACPSTSSCTANVVVVAGADLSTL